MMKISHTTEHYQAVGAAVERNRALLDRFRNKSTSYVEFFSTPELLHQFFDPKVTVYDGNNNEELTATWTDCILGFFDKWGTNVRNQNNRAWPTEEGFFYRHEHLITAPCGEEVFSPGLVVNFVHPRSGKIVRMEEYMDSYAVDPFLRTSFGETRRFDPVRRQPPWCEASNLEVEVIKLDVPTDKHYLEEVGRNIEEKRNFMGQLDEIRRQSASWLAFLEGIRPYWREDASLWQIMDHCELSVSQAYDRYRRLFGVWPNVRIENVNWWPFEEGIIQRMEFRFTTHRNVEIWCPGFSMLFIEDDKIVRWEDYYDSYHFAPLYRTALGETRQYAKSRRQPPFA